MALWVGVHERIGVVVYDSEQQREVRFDAVRLWVHKERRTGVFLKAIVRQALRALDAQSTNTVERPASRTAAAASILGDYQVWKLRTAEQRNSPVSRTRAESADYIADDSEEWQRILTEMDEDAMSHSAANDSGWYYDGEDEGDESELEALYEDDTPEEEEEEG
ncbi:MAG: hypothetical protein RLZ94_154 [Actinomycetota bacterium]